MAGFKVKSVALSALLAIGGVAQANVVDLFTDPPGGQITNWAKSEGLVTKGQRTRAVRLAVRLAVLVVEVVDAPGIAGQISAHERTDTPRSGS